ncbi:MAG: VWA domain-containing protein [Chloroflexi bacterium]|nr:VWA domain-containing protein [Chloroflexota bacterium]
MLSARRRTAWFMVTLALLVVAGLTGSGAWIGTATLSGESLSAPGEVRYQVGILLDGSGSIRDSDFRLMREAFAAVIGNQSVVPRDGSVEITVVQIGVLGIADQVRVEITTTQVTEATVGPIVARLRGLQQGRGMTPTAAGIRRCVSLMRSSPGSATAVRRVINIATDGKPNDPDPDTSARDSLANAIAAAQEAQAAGIDELDAELLGLWSSADLADFQAVIFPQPAEVFTSGQPITAPGFVQIVEDYRDVEAALRHKMRWSVSPPTATPTATATATRPATVGPLVVPLVMQRAGLLTATPTSTPTVSPTATPTATPWSGPMQECLTQVWCDDFSDPNSGWPDSRSEDATIGYVLSRPPDRRAAADGLPGGGEGEYRILIEDWRRGIAAAYPRAEDYAVETRARFESVVLGSLGICFGITKKLSQNGQSMVPAVPE